MTRKIIEDIIQQKCKEQYGINIKKITTQIVFELTGILTTITPNRDLNGMGREQNISITLRGRSSAIENTFYKLNWDDVTAILAAETKLSMKMENFASQGVTISNRSTALVCFGDKIYFKLKMMSMVSSARAKIFTCGNMVLIDRQKSRCGLKALDSRRLIAFLNFGDLYRTGFSAHQ